MLDQLFLPANLEIRLLLVGTDQAWVALVAEAASRIRAKLDLVPDVQTALARMLRPDHVYARVLTCCPLQSREVDALTGMLDEVTLHTTPLIVLGPGCTGVNSVAWVLEQDPDALLDALTGSAEPVGPLAPLSPQELTAALHNGGLRMRFQPIVCRSDFKPMGVEALSRVHTRQRGIMHPKDFIPATVASGRERVLTSVAAARTFLDMTSFACPPDLFVTINLPRVSVLHEAALRRGVELCAVAGISPSRVMIEVLESRTAPDLDQLGVALAAWRHEGFRTAIDDAGPELPHWRELMELPFDAVKLDGTLISDPASQGLLESIVGAAKDRGRFVIAEGIEDEACLDRVQPLEVDALQGFLFSRPLPAMALPLWLEQWSKRDGEAAHAELAA